MRINIYHHEAKYLGQRVELVSKVADTGITFWGVRGYLAEPLLHDGPDDDDSSAITFWIPADRHGNHDSRSLLAFFERAVDLLDAADWTSPIHTIEEAIGEDDD